MQTKGGFEAAKKLYLGIALDYFYIVSAKEEI